MSPYTYVLYWSYLTMYEKCPRRFLWTRGWGDIDLGRGPGKGRKWPEVRPSEHHGLMGHAVQFAIEKLYLDELWRDPKQLKHYLRERVLEAFRSDIERRYIDWNRAPSRKEMEEECIKAVYRYLHVMRNHQLLGSFNKAEYDLSTWINKYNPIGGKPDLVFKRDDTGITILDGKNTKHGLKYVDPDQLKWYALCWYLAFNGSRVDRIGWVFYQKDPEDEDVIHWIPYTMSDLKELQARAIDARRGMEKEKFSPNPVASYCRMCQWESLCEERQVQRKANSAKRREKSEEGLPAALKQSTGVVSFGLDDPL